MTKRKYTPTPGPATRRVIRDARDHTKDYYLDASLARSLFLRGHLIEVNVYDNRHDYYDPDGAWFAERVTP